jgi:hypothetical protein
MQAMMPSTAKPDPGARSPGPDHPAPEAAPAVSPVRRRADLEAQKRYMDDRFGRDRPMNRKPSA